MEGDEEGALAKQDSDVGPYDGETSSPLTDLGDFVESLTPALKEMLASNERTAEKYAAASIKQSEHQKEVSIAQIDAGAKGHEVTVLAQKEIRLQQVKGQFWTAAMINLAIVIVLILGAIGIILGIKDSLALVTAGIGFFAGKQVGKGDAKE